MLQAGQPLLIKLSLGAVTGHQFIEVGMAEGYVEAQPTPPLT